MARPIGGAGVRTRPTQRKGRPVIDLEAIAVATLDEMASAGVKGTTVAAVAARLGVTARTIYHYVENRDGMLMLAERHWIRQAPTIGGEAQWRAELRLFLERTREYLARIPDISDIGMVEGVIDYSDVFYEYQEANLARLMQIGFTERESLKVLIEMVRFALGLARFYGGADDAEPMLDGVMSTGVSRLGEQIERFPISRAAGFIDAGEQADVAIEMHLDGIEAHLRRTSRTTNQTR